MTLLTGKADEIRRHLMKYNSGEEAEIGLERRRRLATAEEGPPILKAQCQSQLQMECGGRTRRAGAEQEETTGAENDRSRRRRAPPSRSRQR